MKTHAPLPLPFPDPVQDLLCLEAQDPSQLNRVIRETVAKRMVRIWDHAVRCVYSDVPGFSKESRASGVYWSIYPNPLLVHLWAEFAPTRKFYAFAGAPPHVSGHVRGQSCLCLRVALGLHPPMPELPDPGRLTISLFVERSVPVKSLLAAWGQRRDDLAHLLQNAGCKVSFGDLMREQKGPYALDGYKLSKSRKHQVGFGCELPRIDVPAQITTPVVALAKIYHAIQGIVRGDAARLAILDSTDGRC